MIGARIDRLRPEYIWAFSIIMPYGVRRVGVALYSVRIALRFSFPNPSQREVGLGGAKSRRSRILRIWFTQRRTESTKNCWALSSFQRVLKKRADRRTPSCFRQLY